MKTSYAQHNLRGCHSVRPTEDCPIPFCKLFVNNTNWGTCCHYIEISRCFVLISTVELYIIQLNKRERAIMRRISPKTSSMGYICDVWFFPLMEYDDIWIHKIFLREISSTVSVFSLKAFVVYARL